MSATTRTTTRTRTLLVGAALAAALLTGGCAGGGGSDSSSGSLAEPAEGPPTGSRQADSLVGSEGGGRADGAAMDTASIRKSAKAAPAEQAIISTGTVSLESDDVGDTRFEVQKVADRAGGTITDEETRTGDDGKVDKARIVLRVPSEEFAATTAALEKLGKLTGSTTKSEDVTTQVIDVDARIRAQEKSVRRIEALLARAANIRAIISIENELSQRQADLDSLKSQQQYLADQTSLSTITVHVERPGKAAKDKEKERTGFLSGLEAGWDGFVGGLVVAATALGYLLPWLLAVALLGVPLWLWLRSRRGRRPVAASQP